MCYLGLFRYQSGILREESSVEPDEVCFKVTIHASDLEPYLKSQKTIIRLPQHVKTDRDSRAQTISTVSFLIPYRDQEVVFLEA